MGLLCVATTMVVFVVLVLVAYFTADYIYTSKQLSKHQKEWDRRKIETASNGENPEDAYLEYVDYLMTAERHPLFGVCLPRF